MANMSEPANGTHYSICTDGEDDADGGGAYQRVMRRGRDAQAGTKEAQSGTREPTWSANAHGRWNKYRTDEGEDQQRPRLHQHANMVQAETGTGGGGNDGSIAASPNEVKPQGSTPSPSTPPPPAAAAATAEAQSDAARLAAGTSRGSRARAADHARSDEPTEPANKSHRGHDDVRAVSVEGGGDDAARAAKLHQEQETAIKAAQAAQAKFGDNVSMQIAGQLYAHKVELVKGRAVAAGVEPSAGGKQLLQLTPEELNTWVTQVLAPAEAEKEEAKQL